MRNKWTGLDPYTKHKELMKHYHVSVKKQQQVGVTEKELLKQHHRFLFDEEEKEPESWEDRVAWKYYKKLFKEYALCNLVNYQKGQIGMRWRSEKEVVEGKGQFECGSIGCKEREGLRAWEVPFSYRDRKDEEKQTVLVKLCLCCECSKKLNYGKEARSGSGKDQSEEKEESQERKKQKTGNKEEVESFLSDLFH